MLPVQGERSSERGVGIMLLSETTPSEFVSKGVEQRTLGLFSGRASGVSLERRLFKRGYAVPIQKIPRFSGRGVLVGNYFGGS
ncbi:MAG: hypothetical protein KAG53_11580 [Endozoicomonadaceae bacterium]|nr:hypothetical protein [Endozoicomonadaceae bacterium]